MLTSKRVTQAKTKLARVIIGTFFICYFLLFTPSSAASEEDTVRTVLSGYGWPHAPHRTLRTPFVREWVARESETQDSRSDEPIIGRTFVSGAEIPIQRFASMHPNIHATGDIESTSLLAGQSWVWSAKSDPLLKFFVKRSMELSV